MILSVIKIIFPAIVSFFVGMSITPVISNFLYTHKMWKPRVRTKTTDGRDAVIFSKLHKDKEVGTPRMGGLIIWISVLITTFIFTVLAYTLPVEGIEISTITRSH